jgi:prophage regulatory protein
MPATPPHTDARSSSRRAHRRTAAPEDSAAVTAVPFLDSFIREPECHEITGLSRSTRWRLERSGKFPRRRALSPGTIGWRRSELMAWLRSR